VLACPTGALTHEIDKKEQVRMGLAELTRPDACLARQAKGWKGPASSREARPALPQCWAIARRSSVGV
jgi:hypothetical protein